jgi:anti-anti-sigma factor
VSREGERTVVWLEGECDIATLPVLAETLAWTMSLGDADLVVDLSRVTFIGAATINALVQSGNLLHGQSRTLTLRSPSRLVTRVLLVCGLTALLEPDRRDSSVPIR